jgi:putative tryptophan/tyrosine transport system substrate-binding protein
LFGIIQAVAPSLRVEVIPINMRDAGEIERSVVAFAHSSIGGLIITPNPFAFAHRDLILTLAAQHKLPAVYSERSFVAAGGLISYGSNEVDQYRQRHPTSIASSRVRNRPTCPCRLRQNTSW